MGKKWTSRLKLIQKALLQKGQEGVTLIELLVVIVILAIIAAVAVPIVSNSVSSAKVSTTKQNMAIIVDALNRYATDHDGQFPSSLDNLTSSDANGGPYLGSVPKDGYGTDFTYTGGTTFSLDDGKYIANSTNETPSAK